MQWGAISSRWQYWSRIKSKTIFDQEKSFPIGQNNLTYHPGPVVPPGGDGSPLVDRTHPVVASGMLELKKTDQEILLQRIFISDETSQLILFYLS